MKNNTWENIIAKVRETVEQEYSEIYNSLDFGAYITPENYFVSYIFKTDNELRSASECGLLEEINDYHKKMLKQFNYPKEAIKDCTFASQEECEKKYAGNWYYYCVWLC